jgi:hypothetical protein
MAGFRSSVFTVSVAAVLCACLKGQAPQFPPPPATKLEAFLPTPGLVFTFAHEDLGNVGGVRVEVREMRDGKGKPVRGLVVELAGAQGLERSFVDADELAGLVGGCDALLQVNSNPTQFKHFEASYATRGSLELTASTSDDKGMLFAVKVGRFRTATRTGLTSTQMGQLRDIFATAAEKLAALPD